MRRLFGTDGIRGHADKPPFDDATLRRLGLAIAGIAPNGKGILIAEDTRESSPRIARAIADGLNAGEKKVANAGVFPTPALSFVLNRSNVYALGVMISASHNPYQDNGIKVLSGNGMKIADEVEAGIEEEFDKISGIEIHEAPDKFVSANVEERYLESVYSIFAPRIRKRLGKAVIDCANGATFHIAPELLGRFIEKIQVINSDPDGKNINRDCGSTHLKSLRDAVLQHNADFGVAFDGDGDRALFIDHEGNSVDGDHILAFCAIDMKNNSELSDAGVVSTVMANFGLEEALRNAGISFHRIESVGDRYVWQRMLETGSVLGGEQSGHIIFRNHSVTGDGIITALKCMEIMSRTGRTLQSLASIVKKYPQHLLNVKVERKPPIESLNVMQAELAKVNSELAGRGRISIRYSGTENLLRIMIEGDDQAKIERCADRLASAAIEDIR
jgi:phosphoglucosamine mutase